MRHRIVSKTDRIDGPIRQRPELAGDGQLLFPEMGVRIADGFVYGRHRTDTADPFEGTFDGLLLAESFARLDLGDEVGAAAWFRENGLVDLYGWTDGRSAIPGRDWPLLRRSNDTADRLADVRDEQDAVRWHLATLARLSERRERMDWDPAFGRVIVVATDDQLVVGGPVAGARLGPPVPQEPGALTSEQAALRRTTEQWPRVTMFERAAPAAERTVERPDDQPVSYGIARDAGTTWEATVELERVLMTPYIERALERQVTIRHELLERDGQTRMALVVREWREWGSILAPIYIQLFAALQRITRGEVGAAVCRECGQPFVVIDARRRLFCNARARYRHTQRQRRQRLAGAADAVDA